MSKTAKILWLVSLVLIAIFFAAMDLGPEIEISLLHKHEAPSHHGGYTISGLYPGEDAIYERWFTIANFLLIAAFAFAIAAVRVWYQDRKEKNETLKEHLAHSRIINIEGKR